MKNTANSTGKQQKEKVKPVIKTDLPLSEKDEIKQAEDKMREVQEKAKK